MIYDHHLLISKHLGESQLSKSLEEITDKYLVGSEKVIPDIEERKRLGIAFAAGFISCVGLFQGDEAVLSAIQNLEIKEVDGNE